MAGGRRRLRARAALRLAGLALFLVALAPALTLFSWAGAGKGSAARFRAAVLRRSARLVLALLGVRVRRSGAAPRAPFVLVSNHLSYLDIAVLASAAPCTFVAKAEVRAWPLLGPIVHGFGTVFLDRERKLDLPRALAAMEGALGLGQGLVLFPEGTTSDGSRVATFRSPLLALPARRGLPVHAAALRYATAPGDPPASESVCWWGDGEFVPHLARLAALSGVEAHLSFDPEPVEERDRKILAARLEEKVRALAEGREAAVPAAVEDSAASPGIGAGRGAPRPGSPRGSGPRRRSPRNRTRDSRRREGLTPGSNGR